MYLEYISSRIYHIHIGSSATEQISFLPSMNAVNRDQDKIEAVHSLSYQEVDH
jgi:hypothetical protein